MKKGLVIYFVEVMAIKEDPADKDNSDAYLAMEDKCTSRAF